MPPWKERLQPFGQLWLEFEAKVRDRLVEMSDDQLRQIIADTGQLNETNCWWATYGAAPFVRNEANRILFQRSRQSATV